MSLIKNINKRYKNKFHRDVALHIGYGCYVETKGDETGYVKGGYVTSLIKDKQGVPVSVRVKTHDNDHNGHEDVININEIYFYEPYSANNQLNLFYS